MNEVYFVGGPWDLTKKILSEKEMGFGTYRIAIYSGIRPILPNAPCTESTCERKIAIHETMYHLRRIGINPTTGRPAYVAMLEDWTR